MSIPQWCKINPSSLSLTAAVQKLRSGEQTRGGGGGGGGGAGGLRALSGALEVRGAEMLVGAVLAEPRPRPLPLARPLAFPRLPRIGLIGEREKKMK